MINAYVREIRRGFEVVYEDKNNNTLILVTVKWGGAYASHNAEQAREMATRLSDFISHNTSDV